MHKLLLFFGPLSEIFVLAVALHLVELLSLSPHLTSVFNPAFLER